MPLAIYLRLRWKLLGRLVREIGWWRLALLLTILLPGLLQAVSVLGHHPLGRWALPLLLASSLLGAHRQRADLRFLLAAVPGVAVRLAAEYALLAVPVALGLLAVRAYGAAVLAPGLAALVAWAPAARESQPTRHRWRSVFRAEAFEWVGGMRPVGVLLWVGLLGLAAWQRASLLAPVLALLGWLLVVLNCYGTAEPPTMLVLMLQQPGAFLRRRLLLGLGYAALTAAPLLALLGSWRLALPLGLYWLGLLALVIVAKYAFYPNATHFRIVQGLVLGLGILGVGQPIFPPLLLVTVGGLIWQSRRRLAQFV